MSPYNPYPYRAVIPVGVEPPQTTRITLLHPSTIGQATDIQTICHEPTRPTYPTCIVVGPHAWFASGERNQSCTFVPVHPTLFRIILLEALLCLGNSCRTFSTGLRHSDWSENPSTFAIRSVTNRLQGIYVQNGDRASSSGSHVNRGS